MKRWRQQAGNSSGALQKKIAGKTWKKKKMKEEKKKWKSKETHKNSR